MRHKCVSLLAMALDQRQLFPLSFLGSEGKPHLEMEEYG